VHSDERGMDWRELQSEHRAVIVQIVVHPSLKAFLSVDERRAVWLWTSVEGMWMERLRLDGMDGCAICGAAPRAQCTACARAVCSRCRCCCGQRILCGMCHHHLCC
jgi:hypothetical protein